MKLQLNTDLKTITIDQPVNLGELYELLNTMFPNFGWKDYLLLPEKEIHDWKDPIKVPWEPQPWFPGPSYPLYPTYPTTNPSPMPWSFPTITCGTDGGYSSSTAGPTLGPTFNLIINKK